jgi:tetratricopeptide (TPR) repeat protein
LLARLKGTLGARFYLLGAGAQDLPERQQTLYRAIEWSYHLLEPSQQRLLRWLTVFVGGCNLETVEAIGQTDGLLDKSLLRQVEQPQGVMRLGMLEMVRAYALEQLAASGEEEAVRRAHGDYYLALAESAHTYLSQGKEQQKWIELLQPEQDNLRTAMQWFAQQGETELSVQLAGALQWFWFVRGYLREGRACLAEVLALPGEARTATRARALNAAGWLAQAQGDYAAAYTLGQQSLAFFRDLDDADGTAWALNTLGFAYVRQGELATGVPLLEESLTLFRSVGNLYGCAFPLSLLGFFALGQKDPADAYALITESLTICRTLDDTQGRILDARPE